MKKNNKKQDISQVKQIDLSYGILTCNKDLMYELELKYVIPICKQYIAQDNKKRGFLLTENFDKLTTADENNLNPIKPISWKSTKVCKSPDLRIVNLGTENIEKSVKSALDNTSNSTVVINLPLKIDAYKEFLYANQTNQVLLLKDNLFLSLVEMQLIKQRNNIFYYLQVFENKTIDLHDKKFQENLFNSYTTNSDLILFAQWFANNYKEILSTNQLLSVVYSISDNRIVGIQKEVYDSCIDLFKLEFDKTFDNTEYWFKNFVSL